MGVEWEVQQAVYTRLTELDGSPPSNALTAAVKGVYDEVPQHDEAEEPDTDFPYVVIGEDIAEEQHSDDDEGFEFQVEIHTWSRYRGRKETKEIQGLIYDRLNLQTMVVTGFNFMLCHFEESRSFLEPDGKTRHGVSLYRVLVSR